MEEGGTRRSSRADGVTAGRRRPTIFDVARRAEVSTSTVSRVVNGRQHIHPETRRRVQAAMADLGYVAHGPARTLASGRTRTIGLLAIEVGTSFFQKVIAGADEQVASFDHDFMLCTTHDRREKEREYVARLSHGMVDGLLVILPRGLTDYVERLRAERFPFVIIDYDAEAPGCNVVNASNRVGARDAINHLLDLGHRRIGFITGTPGVGSAIERLAGYRDALADASVPYDERLVVTGDFLEAGGFDGAHALLSLQESPTAIFASSDTAAIGVVRAARERGLSVPSDLSVVGFDDIPEASLVTPALTTVVQPLREMGRAAVRLLMGVMREPTRPPATVVLSTTLVARDSTAPPRPAPAAKIARRASSQGTTAAR
jgi:LacI family transcriptional regulator